MQPQSVAHAIAASLLEGVAARKIPCGWQVTVAWTAPTGRRRAHGPRLRFSLAALDGGDTIDQLWCELALKAAALGAVLPDDPRELLGPAHRNRTGDVSWGVVALN